MKIPKTFPDSKIGRSLIPQGGNDRIYTPDQLASDIIAHFKPSGRLLEPCAGGGAFMRVLPGCDWCEIDEGRDFLQVRGHWNWIITNPPYSQFRAFLNKSMSVADNVAFLCLHNALFQRARQRDIKSAGFGLVEICECPVPPHPWPQFGMSLGVAWLRLGWKGSTHFSVLESKLWQDWSKEPRSPAGAGTPALSGQPLLDLAA
jgi:hypothetical protein